MIDRTLIEYAKVAHGSLNCAIMLTFLYQGWLGLMIRKRRKAGAAAEFPVIKKHRKLGPFLALLGILGFLAGPTLVYIDRGHVFEYPLHFIVGAFIALCLITTYTISRKIKAGDPWRTPHFVIGILIVFLYVVQVLIGLEVLF
jgi:hypothetical protein